MFPHVYREGGHTHQDRGIEESNPGHSEWREAVTHDVDDGDPLRDAPAGPHHQEAAAHLLGGGA